MRAPTAPADSWRGAGQRVLSLGRPWPLGASVTAGGLNFAVYSAHADAVELCLYDDSGCREIARMALTGRSGDVWHGRLDGGTAGQVYGWRVHGPWAPAQGHRFNPNKLLLDPYAREIVGRFDWQAAHRGDDPANASRPDTRDNGADALKARVVDETYDWQGDASPAIGWSDTVLYEVHVRGFTMRHPGVPEALRGTYAALASDAAVAHLKRLGITALSLLPVHQFLDEKRLVRMGLRNHWGYNTIGFFCPEPRYASAASGRAVRDEFRDMVRRLHTAGIEVILDVVFNHTAETDRFGPTLSWRGLDNASYYRLDATRGNDYVNHTGCGNTLDLRQPVVLGMVMDSLRYWVREMHVDGFRFDLATVLGRGDDGFAANAAFFACLAQDPLLAGIKLIAEPWDIGPDGYCLGRFPPPWREWNDRFRDTMRAFWLGAQATRGDFAQRLCASSERFERPSRQPSTSVNYVVSHDGFTLTDLLSYAQRHNLANGEDNRDGHAHNLSWNCGVEGPSDDPAVQTLRSRLRKALLSTLLLSQGTPMLAAGDELGHSQGGNNNPYCQDNATTWIDWARAEDSLIAFTARVLALRRAWLPLDDNWFDGQTGAVGEVDLQWLAADGQALGAAQWNDPSDRVLGACVRRAGRGARPVLLLFNASAEDAHFVLPAGEWQLLLDSSADEPKGCEAPSLSRLMRLPARSVQLLGPQAS